MHSVIERNGELTEITYRDANKPFIRHIGDLSAFWEVAHFKPPTITYVYDRERADAFRRALELSLSGSFELGQPLDEDEFGPPTF